MVKVIRAVATSNIMHSAVTAISIAIKALATVPVGWNEWPVSRKK